MNTLKWQICPVGDFEHYVAGWDRLNDLGPRSPILNSRFLGAALRTFGTGREVIAYLGDKDSPQALTILQKRKAGVWDTFQPAQAPIGFWVSSPGLDMPVAIEGLLRSLPGLGLLLGITQQDPEILSRPGETGHISSLDYIQTPRIVLRGGFEEYWEKRGKNLRQNIRKANNKLERAGLASGLICLAGAGDVKDSIAHYGRLESMGWKSMGGTAVSIDNPQGRFYIELLESFCEAGQGRIYQFMIDNKIVAMDLCIEYGDSLVILKTAYDESMADYSPAMLMHYKIFQDLFADETLGRIEFYGRYMEWHRRWTEDCRMMFHINYYRWDWLRGLLARRNPSSNSQVNPEQGA